MHVGKTRFFSTRHFYPIRQVSLDNCTIRAEKHNFATCGINNYFDEIHLFKVAEFIATFRNVPARPNFVLQVRQSFKKNTGFIDVEMKCKLSFIIIIHNAIRHSLIEIAQFNNFRTQ